MIVLFVCALAVPLLTYLLTYDVTARSDNATFTYPSPSMKGIRWSYRVHIQHGKSRMAGLQSVEGRMIINSVVWAQYINVTDTQTASRHSKCRSTHWQKSLALSVDSWISASSITSQEERSCLLEVPLEFTVCALHHVWRPMFIKCRWRSMNSVQDGQYCHTPASYCKPGMNYKLGCIRTTQYTNEQCSEVTKILSIVFVTERQNAFCSMKVRMPTSRTGTARSTSQWRNVQQTYVSSALWYSQLDPDFY